MQPGALAFGPARSAAAHHIKSSQSNTSGESDRAHLAENTAGYSRGGDIATP